MVRFMEALPEPEFPWSVCAFGQQESLAALLAASMGGHCRVGFENNLLLADGSIAPDNSALVRQVAALLPTVNRRPATVEEARRILGTREP